MKFRLSLCCALVIGILQALPAMAAWGSFVSMGVTTVNSDPSCAPMPGGKAVCSARGFTNALLVNQFDGTAWSGWTKLAGVVTSGPSCSTDGNGKAICAARATNGGMVYTIFNGTAWSKEVKLKGVLASGPSCASLGGGRVLCAARSSSGGLTSSVFSGSAWSAFDNQAATSTSEPSCAGDDAGRVVCAMRDTTGKIIVNRYNATAWDGFLNISGVASDAPVCSNFGIGSHVVCFARGTDMSYFGTQFVGGAWATAQWTPWATLAGGLVYSKGGCAVIGSGQMICGVIAVTDSGFYITQFNGSSWSGYLGLGQTSVGNPGCAGLGGGKALCTVVGVNNKVQSTVGP